MVCRNKMDNTPKLTQEQEQAFQEELERGAAFEEMMTTKGWSFILSYYQNQIKSFMNTVMSDERPIQEFENKRQELLGLKKLFSQIDSSVRILNDKRKQDEEQLKKQNG